MRDCSVHPQPAISGRRHWLALAALLGCAIPSADAASSDDFAVTVQPFLEQHCLRCHGEKKRKGELRLDILARDFTVPGVASRWHDVLEKITAGEMPPDDEKQPAPADAARIVESLHKLLKEGEAARLARRDPVALRRLTREEYVYTLEDLLGAHFDATDPNGLTEDPEWNGFERLGPILSLSPSHIEKYIAAAQTVLAEAMPEKRPELMKVHRPGNMFANGPKEWAEREANGLADKVRYEIWPGQLLRRGGLGKPFISGTYRCRVQLSGLKPEGGRAPHLAVYAVDLDRVLFEQDVVAPEDKPAVLEFTTHLPAGNHEIFFRNDVAGPSILPVSGRYGNKPFYSIKDGREPWQLKLTDEDGAPLHPFLIIDWINWEGPLMDEGPTVAEKNYLPADSTDRAQVRAAVTRFAERAYRRAVEPKEVDGLLELLDGEIKAGETFQAAFKSTMVAVLCTKDFLYLVEGSPERQSNRLNAFEVASRLSYALWSTMPDDALFAAARNGSLLHREVLKAQFDRMIADPRAKRFATAFPFQWLQLRKLGTFPPDKKLYPDYDKHLELSMAGETTAFFREVLEKNLTLREFLRSDWTMLNARLADHYGLTEAREAIFAASETRRAADVGDPALAARAPGVAASLPASDFRRVSLPPGSQRGGLLTQASILSLTSDGTRHRPVHRGKWVMESIFGKPVPPPPGNVEPIAPTPSTALKATIRMKLEAHKTDMRCAACHRKIDPLGLAFDNFDAIGRWRTEEVMTDGTGDNPPVDASGELADGRRFQDAGGFKELLLGDVDKFNATVVEKLAMFALRRTMTFDDREQLAKIAAQSRQSDYRLRDLAEALVLSDLFQQR